MAGCERCQGNGEIVTDWGQYLHPDDDAPADAGTAECPDCCGTGENGDALIHHGPRGWSRDGDGWWSRPIVRKDVFTAILSERAAGRFTGGADYCEDAIRSDRGCQFGESGNAFFMNGRLYCRNAKQKRRLDTGRPV